MTNPNVNPPRVEVQDPHRLPARQTVTQMVPPPAPATPHLVNPPSVVPGAPVATPKPVPQPAPRAVTPAPVPQPAPAPGPQKPGLLDFVLFCGAGVYEELVFRVLLLGMLMPVFVKLFHMEHAYAAAWATLLGAMLFSAFHHIGSGADTFSAPIFFQRAFAGLFFSVIYLNRSFGVAAVSHSCYDIMVGLNQLV